MLNKVLITTVRALIVGDQGPGGIGDQEQAGGHLRMIRIIVILILTQAHTSGKKSYVVRIVLALVATCSVEEEGYGTISLGWEGLGWNQAHHSVRKGRADARLHLCFQRKLETDVITIASGTVPPGKYKTCGKEKKLAKEDTFEVTRAHLPVHIEAV